MAAENKVPVATQQQAPAAATLWAPFENLRREIDQVFDSFNHGGWLSPFGYAPAGNGNGSPLAAFGSLPAVDLCEKGAAYEISAELPGMSEKDIEIKLSGDTLTLKGEKKEEHEEKKQDYFLTERRYGSFSRSFRLPDGIDADHIEAKFAKGVLTVTLPKTAEAQKKEKAIKVKAA